MHSQLFEGECIRLAPIDPEKDAETISKWTHDPEYLRLTDAEPARPLSPGQVKKKLEEMDKEAEKRTQFNFAIRLRDGDRLIGLASIRWIHWTHSAGWIQLSIGRPEDRGKGYGSEALKMSLRYAFDELNLHRLGAVTLEDNPSALRFLERNGFVVEVRRRQAIYRDSRRWDALMLGLLREEWISD
ncbi:MAG TPA: GNAT family protein [Anaerolineae bacterium]|nr:GNAT family protein [Anaerolineae bacterium]